MEYIPHIVDYAGYFGRFRTGHVPVPETLERRLGRLLMGGRAIILCFHSAGAHDFSGRNSCFRCWRHNDNIHHFNCIQYFYQALLYPMYCYDGGT